MNTYLQITSVWGVYLALVVFIVGMAWRIRDWMTTPRSPIPLGLFPRPKTKTGRFFKMLKDTFIAPQSFQISAAMAFHIAALGAFVGHLRLIREFPVLPTLLGDAGMNAFAAWSGSIAGILMLAAVLFWIARRTYGPYKILSVPEDYLLLALLLGVVVMGDHAEQQREEQVVFRNREDLVRAVGATRDPEQHRREHQDARDGTGPGRERIHAGIAEQRRQHGELADEPQVSHEGAERRDVERHRREPHRRLDLE